MERTSARLVASVALLLTLWIGVYWLWIPSRGRPDEGSVGFKNPGEQSPTGPTTDPAPGPFIDPDRPPVTAPTFRDYTVRQGDSFESIALEAFGSKDYWPVIARANPLKDPRRLSPGQILKIPLDPGNIQGVATDNPDTAPPIPTPEFVDYTVRPGDTLGAISLRFYGSVRFADAILAANRDRLPSAEKLRAGQTLRIPAKPPE